MELEEEDDFIQITEEADLIQAERFIDDMDPRVGEDDDGNSQVRAIQDMILAMNLDEVNIKEQSTHKEQTEEEWQVN